MDFDAVKAWVKANPIKSGVAGVFLFVVVVGTLFGA